MSQLSGSQPRFSAKLIVSIFLIVAVVVGGFYVFSMGGKRGAGGFPPPPVVGVLKVHTEDIRVWHPFSGQLSAVETADIKPLVSGEIQQVLFTDGQLVHKGDLLFVIDPRPYQAALEQAKASLASAQSQTQTTFDQYQRSKKLYQKKLVSASDYDTAKNNYNKAVASKSEAKATLDNAQLNLDYCYIRAPFSGRVSRAEVTLGNIVSAASAPKLTSIVSEGKLYAEFDVDERSYIDTMHHSKKVQDMPVKLTLGEDTHMVYNGTMYSFDNQIDPSSGTIRARAIIDNKDGLLTPGMYAKIELGAAAKESVILVPTKAISTNQNQKYVLVVDAKNHATYRPIVLGSQYKDMSIVTSGLKVGESVVVTGLAHVRPGMPVTPKPDEQKASTSMAPKQ